MCREKKFGTLTHKVSAIFTQVRQLFTAFQKLMLLDLLRLETELQ